MKINEEELKEVKNIFGFNGSKKSVVQSMLDYFELRFLAIMEGDSRVKVIEGCGKMLRVFMR